jgi:hypothetical protein
VMAFFFMGVGPPLGSCARGGELSRLSTGHHSHLTSARDSHLALAGFAKQRCPACPCHDTPSIDVGTIHKDIFKSVETIFKFLSINEKIIILLVSSILYPSCYAHFEIEFL